MKESSGKTLTVKERRNRQQTQKINYKFIMILEVFLQPVFFSDFTLKIF